MNREKSDAPKPEKEERRRSSAPSGDKGPKKESNRRWLFLVVDILLLAAIVAAVLFLVSLLTPFSLFDSDREEVRRVTYTVELAGVERDSLGALKVGDAVVDSETGATIGVVTAVNSRAYEVYTDVPVEDEDLNSYVVTKATYPEEFNTVTVTLSVDADYEAGVGYTVDDCRIAVGRTYELNFPGYAGSGVCVAFNAE
ncbi:MAG: DUF4330 family protein [Clostridia bacterium]|nr:DUF4330 family protein [Clostridia bacterium]